MTPSLIRKTGAALIITGTCVGAGMLVLPLITAACGFVLSCILLMVIALLMMATAFLILEVNMGMVEGTSFSRMAYQTLGTGGQIVAWLSFLLLMYSLTAAYTAQGASLLSQWLQNYLAITLPDGANSLLFISVLGTFVYTGTFAVDQLNKILITLKGLAFLILSAVIAPHIRSEYLLTTTGNINYLWVTLPLLITSFGYHTVLPSIRTYLRSNKRALTQVVLAGSLTPLVIYLIWELITLGTLPLTGPHSFAYISNHGDDVSELIQVFHDYYHIPAISSFATIFTNVAITTSFLGVTLGLFNFNQDTYHLRRQCHSHRLLAFVITYGPPWLFAVYYPDGFVMALGYASVFVAVLLISMPALMAWQQRRQYGSLNWRGRVYLGSIIAAGGLMIALEVATELHLLPRFST